MNKVVSTAFGLAMAGALLAPPLFASGEHAAREYDDCDAKFIAFLGADAYQFSPLHEGELGKVRLHTILSFQKAAALEELGRVAWQLEIRGPLGAAARSAVVRTAEGSGRIEADGQLKAEFFWDGRDQAGKIVPAGKYQYSFLARFVADSEILLPGELSYAALGKAEGVVEAYASTDELIVDYGLTADAAEGLRDSLAATLCQLQQNTPLESGFGWNFYYGSTHSHSNWSDGGYPTSACASGNVNGSGTSDPAAVYNLAKNSAGLDFWVINEHNHLIDDAMATNNAPMTAAKVKARYAAGLAAANSATVNGDFVGLYGMEWGVSSNNDQGHLTFLETPKLFGWEPCTTCNGPNAECTGSACLFDVFTPKRYGYLTAYKRSVENPSAAGALGIFCHPGNGNFDNFAFNADADAAMQGIAVRSGLAFNTADNCSNANVASSDYSGQWLAALNKGFHLGPVAEHDTHCNNYGSGLPNRTVYLLPNGSSPALTKLAMLQAHKARHFFASEDSNAQLVFATSGAPSGKIMGDIFSAAGTATLRAAVYDPNGEAVSTLEIWRGQIGGGIPASPRVTASASTLSITDNFTSGTYYYYVHAVQADGHDLWSAPMWITYGPGGGGGGTLAIGGYSLTQANSASTYTIPAGTTIPANGYLVIGRNATKAAFQTFWGATLPATVGYLNAADTMPLINGSETYTLKNGSGTTIDGVTVAMPSAADKTLQRVNPCSAANLAANWTTLATTSATPGSGAAAGCAKGLVINEFADASGSGNYVYEFIELHWDQ
jgi:hypothetical protein